jgi:7,8-dihydropterin-6-yl-methyl-4-(beta-D-ribofuranosyl)aminobenzene 5'-phosphate synthase
MNSTVRITVLVENTAQGAGLLAEHGLACWIEYAGRRVLFDTGQGGVIASNAYRLGIPLYEADAVVLSHGHYDHTGGLVHVLRESRLTSVYAHPAALEPKYARNKDGTSREIGMPYVSQRTLRKATHRWVKTESPTEILNGLSVTGPVPRGTDFEDTGGPFFLDAPCKRPDPLVDDQSLFFESAEGMVVLLGCAHSGVVNTLHYVRQLTENRPVLAVIGGMHLVGASEERLRRSIEKFGALEIRRIAPAHCTGRPATMALWNAFPKRCVPCHVGSQFEFDVPHVTTMKGGGRESEKAGFRRRGLTTDDRPRP